MKLYLAVERSITLMEGTYEEVLGVYSTPELAEAAFLNSGVRFTDKNIKKLSPTKWEKVYDGELTVTYTIEEVTLNSSRR